MKKVQVTISHFAIAYSRIAIFAKTKFWTVHGYFSLDQIYVLPRFQRWSPRGQILKSLALKSTSPQKRFVLGSRSLTKQKTTYSGFPRFQKSGIL